MVPADKKYPAALLQEILWPNRWQCTVACLLLNRTKRAQVDKVWPTLFEMAPDPETLLRIPTEELVEVLRPLGFYNTRAKRLQQLATAWGTVPHRQLPGVGTYANQSDRIFFSDDLLENEVVEDHALVAYVEWRRTQPWKRLC